MFGAIYNGLSGMSAYSRGLDIISNNVANLNTPGFKMTQAQYSNIERQAGESGLPGGGMKGAGVSVDASRLSFKEGDFRDTGNALDAAIDGEGFFVLDIGGQQFYTRVGQFEFNKDGVLVDQDTGGKVMVQTETDAMQPFSIESYRIYAPKATTTVTLSGNLARSGDNNAFTITLTTIDTSGGKQMLHATFTRDATDPLMWSVEVFDADNNSLGIGTIQLASDGTPSADQQALTFEVTPTDLPAYTITLNIGAAGSVNGVSSKADSVSSTVQALRQDGVEIGALTDTILDEKGRLQLTYSNGEKLYPATLLLAGFRDPGSLKQLGGSLFSAEGTQLDALSVPSQNGLGFVKSGRIELSNVDLTDQFTDMIVVQRGYQASSQTMSVANEMLQQLLSMQNGR